MCSDLADRNVLQRMVLSLLLQRLQACWANGDHDIQVKPMVMIMNAIMIHSTGEPAIVSPQLLYFILNPECWLKISCALASSTSSSSWVLVRCLFSPKDFLRLKVYYCPGLLHHLHESHSEFGLCYQLNINVKRLCLKA